MAFPNVAVRLHGCSPGNEACEFEQGSTNHFITPNIVSGVSLEGAFIKKNPFVSQATMESSQSACLFDFITACF